MNTINNYHKQATDFLEKFGITFEAINLGTEVSRIDNTRKNYRYLARFKRNGKEMEVEFHGSIADYEASCDHYEHVRRGSMERFIRGDKRRAILNPYDVLASLTKYNPGMFSDFCSEYGYDNDSRKAFTIYESVCEEWNQVSRFFTKQEIEEMQEIQ